MDEGLLSKRRDDDNGRLTWRVFGIEAKKFGYIAGPMVAVTLSQFLLQVISVMFVGHLGELALSSTAIAISISSVTGFSFIVSSYLMFFEIYIYSLWLLQLVLLNA